MDQVIRTFDGLKDYTFHYIAAVPDYKSYLKGCYVDFPAIASVHIFHFTQDGITSMASNSRDTNWRLDNSVEPFKMMRNIPLLEYPPLIVPPKLSADRIAQISKTKKPAKTEVYILIQYIYTYTLVYTTICMQKNYTKNIYIFIKL